MGSLLKTVLVVLMVSMVAACAYEEGMDAGQVEQDVRAKWDAEPELSEAELDVAVDAEKKEVVVSGTVNSEEVHQRAVEVVKTAHPDLVVVDNIQVEMQEEMDTFETYTEEKAAEERSKASEFGDQLGESLQDAWIHSKIVAQLIADTETAERTINVDVAQNVVTLRGTVKTEEAKAEAERIARETEGVTQVNNQLKVQP